jgi:TonB family protein
MRLLIAITFGVLIVGAELRAPLLAQEGDADTPRKIINRAIPVYPELARKMSLEGSVKLQVTVAPNGTVKSVQAVGGSPLLVKAAEDSVYKFRWIPARQESKELVEMRFHPDRP